MKVILVLIAVVLAVLGVGAYIAGIIYLKKAVDKMMKIHFYKGGELNERK